MTPRLLLLVTLLATLLVAGCRTESSPVGPTLAETQLVFGTPQQPNSLNPITSPDLISRAAIELIFDGLLVADDELRLKGALAETWEVSPDGLELLFHLKSGVAWHDGRPFTAEDVAFTYGLVLNPNAKPTVAKNDYTSVVSVEAVDPLMVRFRLSRPDSSLPAKLTLGIAPKHLLAGADLATAEFNFKPVGTGPFILESWDRGQSLVFKRNGAYHGGAPKIQRLIWQVIPDSTMLAVQLLKGDVQVAPVLNPADVAAVESSGRLLLRDVLEGNTQISLQLRNPLFQDIRVRRALAHAIDRPALIQGILQGAAVPSVSDIVPASWAYNEEAPSYPFDPVRARALLAEAGWTTGPQGVLQKDGKALTFSLATDAGHKPREQVALAVAQYWRDVGVDARVTLQERNSFVSQRILRGDFDAALLQSAVQVDPDPSRRFHSGSIKSGQNFLNYSSPEADRLLEQALATSDQQLRKKLYADLQVLLASDLPQISLYYPVARYAFDRRIQGARPSSASLFWNVEKWEWQQ